MRSFTWVAALVSVAAVSCGTKANGTGDETGDEAPSYGGSYSTNPFASGGTPATGFGGSTATLPPPSSGGFPVGAGGVPATGLGGSTATLPPPGSGGYPVVSSGGAPAGGAGTTAAAAGGATGTGGSTYVAPPGAKVATLVLSPFQAEAGQEYYMCQNYDNPFGGQDAAVQDIVTDMTQGAHHMHIFYGTSGLNNAPDPSRTLEPCSGIEFHPLLFASQLPHMETAYAADMASKVPGTTGLRMQIHILNTTSDTLNVNMQAKLTAVDPSTITTWVGTIYYNNLWLSVPPGQSTSTTTCNIPADFGPITLIGGGSHMHSRGVHFVASTSTGTKLYETTQWEEPPPSSFNPPVPLNPGDSLTWSCTYQNSTSSTLTFGEHAATNEMCIFVGSFTSSPSGNMLECQAYTPQGQTGISAVAE